MNAIDSAQGAAAGALDSSTFPESRIRVNLCNSTGAMGTRTIHQADAKAQLLVRVAPSASAASAASAGEDDGSGDEAAALDAALQGGAADSNLKVSRALQRRARAQPSQSIQSALWMMTWQLR